MDIDPAAMNMSPAAVGPKTKAIAPVLAYGLHLSQALASVLIGAMSYALPKRIVFGIGRR
jgi:hypothetical protein